MKTHKSKRLMIVGMLVVLALASTGIAGHSYAWEKWGFPGSVECSITYGGKEYKPVAAEGFLMIKASYPYDLVDSEESDWIIVFEAPDGSKIKLEDASWNGHTNTGWKETFNIYPGSRCLKTYYEADGTWCGYDAAHNVYFWGRWSTSPQGRPYYIDYVSNGHPEMKGLWTVEGCSVSRGFEPTEGTFLGARMEYGRD